MSINQTVIKYIVTGQRLYEIPIINNIPIRDIEIKTIFPNNKVTVTHKYVFNNNINPIANKAILETKNEKKITYNGQIRIFIVYTVLTLIIISLLIIFSLLLIL